MNRKDLRIFPLSRCIVGEFVEVANEGRDNTRKKFFTLTRPTTELNSFYEVFDFEKRIPTLLGKWVFVRNFKPTKTEELMVLPFST